MDSPAFIGCLDTVNKLLATYVLLLVLVGLHVTCLAYFWKTKQDHQVVEKLEVYAIVENDIGGYYGLTESVTVILYYTSTQSHEKL